MALQADTGIFICPAAESTDILRCCCNGMIIHVQALIDLGFGKLLKGLAALQGADVFPAAVLCGFKVRVAGLAALTDGLYPVAAREIRIHAGRPVLCVLRDIPDGDGNLRRDSCFLP